MKKIDNSLKSDRKRKNLEIRLLIVILDILHIKGNNKD